MSKETKISVIALAAVIVLFAAILAVNFIVYPVYNSYTNDDGETRVQIGEAVYKHLSDPQWSIDAKRAGRIGNLDKISTTLYEYQGDSGRNAVFVYTSSSVEENSVLIKEGIELGSVSQENVSCIKFDDPDANRFVKTFFEATFETFDESLIAAFFAALEDGGKMLSADEVTAEDMEKVFTLKCCNKTLPIASAQYVVYVWNGQFLCYDAITNAYTIMPSEVFTEIAGGGFDAEKLL